MDWTLTVVAQSCVNVVFELALGKYKQPIPRNSFNLRYRLNHTITLLQTYVLRPTLIGFPLAPHS